MNKFYILVVFSFLSPFIFADSQTNWQTHAERTAFQETGRYAESIEFSKQLESASPWVQYKTFGKSPEGRDLPLLIVSREKLFTPEAARKANRLVVLIVNGIHAGEIAGKDATLMLLREMIITKKMEKLLENVVLLAVPIFSVDGHERFGPYNRINQNGPKEMGWRTTSQNLNLNRDWMKADQPEMQDMLKLFGSWLPDMMIDNHVTDGADFQYDVLYIVQKEPFMPSPIAKYWKETLEPKLVSDLTKAGHVTGPYFEMVDDRNPAAGISFGFATPRFSDGYASFQNRFAMTVETHMLKPYDVQVRGHYDLMVSLLEELNRSGTQLKQAEVQADQDTVKLGASFNADRKIPIGIRLNTDKKESVRFRGVEYKNDTSSISGDVRVEYGKKPVDIDVPLYRTLEVTAEITPPLAYLIPPQWTDVIDRLRVHNISFSRTSAPFKGKFEVYRFHNIKWPEKPFEGRHLPKYEVTGRIEEQEFQEDSVLVRLNQRSNRVILGLLEPSFDDSFVAWGFFNAIFEQKEFAEAYVLEALAQKMLSENQELKKEFEQKLKTDSKFAADPSARLNYFFERSPYWDSHLNLYPIARIIEESQLKAIPIRNL